MEREKIKEFREKLGEEKNEIETILSSFASREDKGNWETKFPQFGRRGSGQEETADEVEEYTNLLPVEYKLELQLLDIERALDKIEREKGKYGICEKCGEEIKEKRLNAIPETKFCSKCRV